MAGHFSMAGGGVGSEAKSLATYARERVFSGPWGQMPGWRGPDIHFEGATYQNTACATVSQLLFFAKVSLFGRALTATAAAVAAATAARRGGRLLQVVPPSLKRLSLGLRTRGGRAAFLGAHWTKGSRCYPVARSVARRR